MKIRYKVIIVVAVVFASLQALTVADCLEDDGQPGLFTCTWVFTNFILPQAFAEPFVNDDTLIDNLKQNQLPIGQGVYMDFTFFLALLGGGIGGTIFAVRRKRK